MKLNVKTKAWWGPPKSFSTEIEDRKVSWLELFYDLVYVIAIAKITHHLAGHLSLSGLLDFIYFFVMIFWGWLNGSLYHDIHASTGLRTRLMTLWQMLIVAALVITSESAPEHLLFNITIVLMLMQLFITYLWWSVGIYDKYHRKLNRPYTILYLLSFGLMVTTLFLEPPYLRIVFFCTLILNYIPPFISQKLLKRESLELNLSSSMSERLGLFTIIIFGEVIAGVISGASELHEINLRLWLNFCLSVFIVFALWWLFFTLVSDRQCKPGFINSSLLEILYLPTLIALGLLGMAFGELFENYGQIASDFLSAKEIFGYSLCLFLLGMNLMMYFLAYPPPYTRLKKKAQGILYGALMLALGITLLPLHVSLFIYLLIHLVVILSIILLLNYNWYIINSSTIVKAER